MTKARGSSSIAAIGGLTATIALLTGLPVASADELADLRANQELLQRRIDQLAQAAQPTPFMKGPGTPGAMGAQPTPGAALIGGSFPRSFLIPGTDTSIRVGGFIDLTGLYYFQGNNNANPGTPSSNFGQNGNLNSVPIGLQFVPGLGTVPPQQAHARGNGVFTASPQQSRFNVETRTGPPCKRRPASYLPIRMLAVFRAAPARGRSLPPAMASPAPAPAWRKTAR
jgi:hypothetical protein